jgi:diguanylate cyclase (GGDEF)-like protein
MSYCVVTARPQIPEWRLKLVSQAIPIRHIGARLHRALAFDPWWFALAGACFIVAIAATGSPAGSGQGLDILAEALLALTGVLALIYSAPREDAQRVRELESTLDLHAATAHVSRHALEDPQLSVFLKETIRLVVRTLELDSCGIVERADADVDPKLSALWESGLKLESQTSDMRTGLDVEIESGGTSYGVLHISTTGDTELSSAQQDFLHTIARIVARAIERDRATAGRHAREAQLTYRATHDALTDLPNRALFADRLHHAAAQHERDAAPIAVLFVDLDDFKRINDTFGHTVGDHVLAFVAERIKSCLRLGDTAARMGGDEFAVLLEGATREVANQVAARISEALQTVLSVREHSIHISASIGVGVGSQLDDNESLVRDADTAMYAAKRQSKIASALGARFSAQR